MKLTVDASIVVKWFVAEPLHREARRLLSRRIDLHAPDLVLSEFANTIWKKARAKEIPNHGPYLNELTSLPEIISLFPDRELIERAARMAITIDHPVYDCLYLACAEATGSDVITADRRLANKSATQSLGVRVEYLGDAGVAEQIETAAYAPAIERRKVEELSEVFDFFAETERSVLDKLFAGREGLRITTDEDRELYLNSPACKRLIDAVQELEEEEFIDLLALGWLGAGLFPDWRRSVEHAEKMVLLDGINSNYASGYGRHWRAGFERIESD
ncbi:MAG: type II toxin-antitoxin system VapC family toxin [Nitrospinae bacterium]|nr:type II toxin-antitoxin system VapC family toxin [Nitrospinota bacterium]